MLAETLRYVCGMAHVVATRGLALQNINVEHIEEVVRPERFELPAFWFVARRSIQLSYGRTIFKLILIRLSCLSRYSPIHSGFRLRRTLSS
jgi:hypothetical protein